MGSAVREQAAPARIIPGTPIRKVIPLRMVGPYLSGQRDVIAGFVHRARDLPLRRPAEAFHPLRLGFDGSEFRPDMPELFFLLWHARAIDGYVPAPARSAAAPAGRGPEVAEFYLEPVQIPVGTALCRLSEAGEDVLARYDGLAWRRQSREG